MSSLSLSTELQAELQSKYTLLEVVGRGGTAVVLRARHLDLDRDVAIKVKTEGTKLDAKDAERFLLEGRIMAKLQHPHLVPVYESGATASELYLVCEYAAGGTLAQRLKKTGPLPVPEALRIVGQVVEGLAALHEHGIVHRDLKPANVLLGQDDVIKITDFGLAKTEDRDFRTEDGNRLGTPDYMAPEQILGEPQGPPTDHYALGVMTFFMLTGQLPFDGATDYQILHMKLHETAPRVSSKRPDVCGPVDRLVAMLLERRAEDRPQDAAAVRSLLEEARRPPPRSANLQATRSGIPSRPGPSRQGPPSPSALAAGEKSIGPRSRPHDTRRIEPAAPRRIPVAGLLASLALMALGAAFLLRSGADGRFGPLRLEIGGDRLTLRGAMSGRRPFHLQIRSGSSDWKRSEAVTASGEVTLGLALEPSATEGQNLRLCQGDTVLFELWLPMRPRFRTPVDLVHFSLEKMSPGPDAWRALYASSGEPTPVEAKPGPGIFRFDWTPPQAWSTVRLVALEGSARVTSVTDPTPRRIDVRWDIGVAFPTLTGLEKQLRQALEEAAAALDPLEQKRFKALIRQGKPGTREAAVAELAAIRTEASRVAKERMEQILEKLLGRRSFDADAEAALTRAWREADLPWPDRWHHYLWMQELGKLEAWARRWGVDCPLDSDRLMRELIPLTRRPFGTLELPEDRSPLGLARQAMGSSAVDMLARNTLGESIGRDQFLKPDSSHRPSRLEGFLDAQNWKQVHKFPVSGKRAPDREDQTLRLAVWNLSPFFYLTLRFDEWPPGERLCIFNPMNELNPRMEGASTLEEPDNPHSWLNLPNTTMTVELRLPAPLVPPEGSLMTAEGFELPGALPSELMGMVLIDARWIDTR